MDGLRMIDSIGPIMEDGPGSFTTARKILETARDLVAGDRERSHGDKLENHRVIAEFWTTYLGNRPREPITALDAANMMELLKIARRMTGTHNPDDYIDAAGYAAVAGEIADRLSPRK